MKAFRFPLEKALEWRRTELELEENRMRQLSAELGRVETGRAEVERAGRTARERALAAAAIEGSELGALDAYLDRLRSEQKRLLERRREIEHSMAEQQKRLLEAQRRLRLIERLRERRLGEWRAGFNRELENFASEVYLAGWNKRDQ